MVCRMMHGAEMDKLCFAEIKGSIPVLETSRITLQVLSGICCAGQELAMPC